MELDTLIKNPILAILTTFSCKYTYRDSDREWKSQTQTIEPYAAAIENYER